MLIDIHCHHSNRNSHSIITLGQNENIPAQNYFSFGLHPWLAESISFNEVPSLITSYVSHPNFLMLGEIGLDRACEVDFQKQIKLFKMQLGLANELKIQVLLIHCVRSLNDILNLVKISEYQGTLIFHDSNFSKQEIVRVVSKGYYLSFGDNLFRENSKALQTIAEVDRAKLFLESGDGKHGIEDVYKKAAFQLKTDDVDLGSVVLKNFHNLFLDRNIAFDFR